MAEKPKLIFKYRALNNREDIDRFYDIIQNNRLYLPTIPQVNDPFEGKIDISTGVAGDFIRRAMDIDFFAVRECKQQTRLLALSEDCYSPQLWAYYCNDYRGVCLCYYTNNTFSHIQPVQYLDNINEADYDRSPTRRLIYELIRKSMFKKQEGWRYEREWRLVFQPELADDDSIIKEAGQFLDYQPDELAGIIIGDKIEQSTKEIIRALAPDRIKIFEVHTGAVTGKVKLMDYGYRYPGDGSDPDFIATLDELYERICG